MFYAFFWVIPRRLKFICQRFGTLSVPSSWAGRYLPAYEDGTDRVFRNVDISNSDTRELPIRKRTTYHICVDMCNKNAMPLLLATHENGFDLEQWWHKRKSDH
jgi:hypothetical protein